MMPILPPHEDRSLAEIEREPGFATYGWAPPLCPWCGSWLRPVDMRPKGMPIRAATACPYYHGLFAFNQSRWVGFKPPKVKRGSDGAWWTTLTHAQLSTMAAQC